MTTFFISYPYTSLFLLYIFILIVSHIVERLRRDFYGSKNQNKPQRKGEGYLD